MSGQSEQNKLTNIDKTLYNNKKNWTKWTKWTNYYKSLKC